MQNTGFSSRLTQLREQRSMSKATLALELSISRASLVNYESGKRVPDIEILGKIADYFDVSTDFLLGRSNYQNPAAEDIGNSIGLDDKALRTLEIYNKIEFSDEERRFLSQFIVDENFPALIKSATLFTTERPVWVGVAEKIMNRGSHQLKKLYQGELDIGEYETDENGEWVTDEDGNPIMHDKEHKPANDSSVEAALQKLFMYGVFKVPETEEFMKFLIDKEEGEVINLFSLILKEIGISDDESEFPLY